MIAKVFRMAALFLAVFFVAGMSAYFALTAIIRTEETVIVPDLTGKSLVHTLELMTKLGLNTKVKGSEYSGMTPKHHILFQDPLPGRKIKKGRDIRIILSKGAKSIKMPNLRALTAQQAQLAIEENDLIAGTNAFVFSPVWEKDQVIAHSPPAGNRIHPGDQVNLLISIGARPKFYMMPDLRDLSLDEAVARIARISMRIGEIQYIFKSDQPLNTIVSQEPRTGQRIQQGTPVDLIINRQQTPEPRKISNLFSGPRLFRYRLGEGFMKKRIRVQVECFGLSADFHNSLVKPGTEIWSLVPSNTKATMFLYSNDKLVTAEVFDTW
ncbi:MAG: PASTA domain-containing protein [Thermodesulfobacteriota bacterium]